MAFTSVLQDTLDYVSHTSPSLVLVQDTLSISSALLLRELIYRAHSKSYPILLLCSLRAPGTYWDSDSSGVAILDGHRDTAGYDDDEVDNPPENSVSLRDPLALLEKLQVEIRKAGPEARLSVIIDSLDEVVDNCNTTSSSPADTIFQVIRGVLTELNQYSRLIVAHPIDSTSFQAQQVFASLSSPSLWPGKIASHDNPTGRSIPGSTTLLRIHPPSLAQVMLRKYSLRPPSTPETLVEALSHPAKPAVPSPRHLKVQTKDSKSADTHPDTDPRFWEVLRSVGSRGPFGADGYDDDRVGSGVESALRTVSSNSPVSLADLSGRGEASHDANWALLEAKQRSRNGRVSEDVLGCVRIAGTSGVARLALISLDLEADIKVSLDAGSSSHAGHEATHQADTHSSMVSNLPFNLTESEDQRSRRDGVPLPYAYYKQNDSATPQRAVSNIIFEPESGDDEDDDEPDDDLDL